MTSVELLPKRKSALSLPLTIDIELIPPKDPEPFRLVHGVPAHRFSRVSGECKFCRDGQVSCFDCIGRPFRLGRRELQAPERPPSQAANAGSSEAAGARAPG